MPNKVIERRKARKKWLLRLAATEISSDIRCAACNDRGPPVRIAPRYSETRFLELAWRCTRCGNQWTTSAKAPA
jgi:transposase-like protein